jgi:hypothetical protein
MLVRLCALVAVLGLSVPGGPSLKAPVLLVLAALILLLLVLMWVT